MDSLTRIDMLIGFGLILTGWIGKFISGVALEYIKNRKNNNSTRISNPNVRHCKEHDPLVVTVTRIDERTKGTDGKVDKIAAKLDIIV